MIESAANTMIAPSKIELILKSKIAPKKRTPAFPKEEAEAVLLQLKPRFGSQQVKTIPH